MLDEQLMMPASGLQEAKSQELINPKKIKGKKYNGLIEWICDREGHEFLVHVDRGFIRDSFNLFGVEEQFFKELNIGQDSSQTDKQKKMNKNAQKKRF